MPSEEEAATLKAFEEEFEKPTLNVNGRIVPGLSIPIDHIVERTSEVHLTDGTVILVRQTVAGAVRAVGEWDPSGNPVYALNMQAHMTIERTPKSLRNAQPEAPSGPRQLEGMPSPIMPPKAGLNVSR
jgi:hypothetical protein